MKRFFRILRNLLILLVIACLAVVVVWRREIASLSTVERVAGNEYLYRSVYIGDYIYALDRDGNCTSFRPEI